MARNLNGRTSTPGKGRPFLALAMIVRDEEESLARCLAAAKEAVDEIVIVDTGSTDRTEEIAREFGARVGHFEWCDDFSAARNTGLEMVTAEWVLHLDADEELADALDLRRRLQRIDAGTWAVELPVVSLRDRERRVREQASFQKRLFRSSPATRFERPIHEEIMNPEGGSRDRWESPVIWHTGYADDAVRQAKVLRRNLPILEKAIQQDPTNPVYPLQLALLQPDLEGTWRHYERALQLLAGEHRKSELFHMATIRVMERLRDAGRFNESIAVGAEMLKTDATPDIATLTGQVLVLADQLDRAEKVLKLALSLPSATTSQFLPGSSTWLPRLALAEVARRRGQHALAASLVEQALTLGAAPEATAPRLAVLRALSGRTRDATAALGMAADSGEAAVLAAAAERAFEARDALVAEEAWSRLVAVRGEPGDFLGLARALEALAYPQRAIEALEDGAGRHPACVEIWLGLARLHDTAGRRREALEAAGRVVDLDTRHVEALLLLARSQADLMDHRGAVETASRALELEPENVEAIITRAQSLVWLQELQEAYDLLYTAAAANPGDTALQTALSDVLERAGEYDEAVNVLAVAIDRRPDDPGLYAALGKLLGRAGRYEDALNAIEIALARGAQPGLLEEAWKILLQAAGRAGIEVPSPVRAVFSR